MNLDDTIIIFEKPELYFFPEYKDIVFSPFGVPVHSLRYWIYKVLHMLGLPCCSCFWGEWRKHVRDAGKVIIFDYGYQAGMEQYIHKINPDCRVYLFFWNIITDRRKNHLLFTDQDAIYSTDRSDCASYGFRYNHMFYCKKLYVPRTEENARRIFFLGVDKGRGRYITLLKKQLARCGLDCDISLICHSRDRKYRRELESVLTDRVLSYPEYCGRIRQCGILLDICQPGQRALTMRVVESVYYSKKLITNNADIINYDFYHPNNIMLLPDDVGQLTEESIRRFLKLPFVPYPESILDAYDMSHWAKQFGAV